MDKKFTMHIDVDAFLPASDKEKEYIKANDLEIHPVNRRSPNGEDWELIDLGSIVVHLMSAQAREFYNLEKLWFNGKVISL